MVYGIIESGIVINAVEATDAFAAEQGWVKLTRGAGIGWGYADGKFTAPSGPLVPMTAADVDAERDRRIEDGFLFKGKMIQSRPGDRENIAGAKSAAQDAKLLGAEPGEYGWQLRLDATNGAPAFAWITADDSLLPLDADDMIAMGYAAMLHKQRLIFVAKGIKNQLQAGEAISNVADDTLWS